MKNVSEYNLTDLVSSWAVEIFEQSQDQDEALELASQYADGTEWVIYHYKAHQLCAAVNTDNGEAMLEDIGTPDGATYDSLASLIAYFEIEARLRDALLGLFDMQEELEKAGAV